MAGLLLAHPSRMNFPIPKTPDIKTPSIATEEGPDQLLAEITVHVGADEIAKYSISHGEYLIGRDESCHISINADRVSRHHARLTFNAHELVIEDLESSNGVFIDGIQLQLPTRLGPDQEVQIGSARVVVRLDDMTAKQVTDALWDADLGLAPVREQLTGKKYKVVTTIARGGMGVILQARDLRVRRSVAMKVMKTGGQFSRENVLRFIEEAQLTGQLDHPNIVPVYELGIDRHGEAFYTMKYIKGITLEEVLRGLRHGRADMLAKYPLTKLLTIFQKICDAVAFAHSKEVVHRDLKPENIMIGSYGEVFVMDWGLAKQMAAGTRADTVDSQPPLPRPKDPLRGFETLNGVVIGTPPYVSPEQARGELDTIDRRSDIYVLGGILYAILTLRAPIDGESLQEILEKIIAGKIDPPVLLNRAAKPDEEPANPLENSLLHCPGHRIPEGLSAVAMKALQTDVADRYQTVEEMQVDLNAYESGFAPKAERAGLWRQALLFGARHKREMGVVLICALLFNILIIAFIIQLTQEKNKALTSEANERAGAAELARALNELRGAAPTFAAEAASLVEQQKPDAALEKIDYAIEQVPNQASYHTLRGNILQSLLRFDEAVSAYQEALSRNAKDKMAQVNLALTRKLIAEMGAEGNLTQPILRELHSAMVSQKRVGEAVGVYDEIEPDRRLAANNLKAIFEKHGIPIEVKEDNTFNVDMSHRRMPELRMLRAAPVSGLHLDDTGIREITPLKGLPLTMLSLGHTQVTDLSPLIGMPLMNLNLDGAPVTDLTPLQDLPLETLRLSGTKVTKLDPLRGLKLELLNISGCRDIKDLGPLASMPVQRLDLSRSGVSDLTPLIDCPLRELNLEGCTFVVDLHPLMQLESLETVIIPAHCKDIGFLRNHPSLKRLSYSRSTETVYEFWRKFDVKKSGSDAN